MFARARRRLAWIYVALFGLVIFLFSIGFLVLIAIVMEPDFDLAPDASGEQAAQLAYEAAVQRIAIALVIADALAIALVGIAAWLLAARTLRPIREAHERQRRFVADASHEMRTPLTAIRAAAEGALSGGASGAQRDSALATVAAASAQLGSLTNDLLTLAQADDSLVRPTPVRFDLSVAIAERLALVDPGRHAQVQADFAPDLIVSGSPDEVGRITDNLVDNALRYGGSEAHVRVATRAVGGEAVVEVSDDGLGIAPADQSRIFEPFYRVRADSGAPDGSGLGLAIAQALARRNGARLTLDSEPGHGTRFRLVLPLAR